MLFLRLKVGCASTGKDTSLGKRYTEWDWDFGNSVLAKKMNSRQLWTSLIVGAGRSLYNFRHDVTLQRKYFIYISMHVGMDIEMYSYSISFQSNLEFEVTLKIESPIDE